MTRQSPQTTRLVQVLEDLAAAGRSGRTLAELARSLGVDKATCRPMLMELTEAGYLIRHPRRKTFHLGPRLVAIGRAAEHAVDVVDIARQALATLADDTGLSTLAITASADELVVADVVPPAQSTARMRRALGLRAGDRIPYRPPFGAVLAAWSAPRELQRWRNRTPTVDGDQIDRVLTAVRQRGFAVEQFRPDPQDLADLVEQSAGTYLGSRRAAALLGDPAPLPPDAMVGPLTPESSYWPVSINAPVLDADERAVMAVCLVDIDGPLDAQQVGALGQAAATTARAISRHLAAKR